MLDFVCFKWRATPGARYAFSARTVNVLERMLARHYHKPYRLTCVTDDPVGICDRVRVLPLWDDHASLVNPLGAKAPSCYRRLKLFAPEMAELIGPRFVALDLDCVIVGDLAPLFDRPDTFVINRGSAPKTPYNGSMLLMSAGARAQVWSGFHPVKSPAIAKQRGFVGSDQAWISACLPDEPTWGSADGVYAFQTQLWRQHRVLPKEARIVFFQGAFCPWLPNIENQYSWVRDHYN